MFFADDFERVRAAHDVDRVATASAGLATYRAVATIVCVGRIRLDGKTDLAAMTGTLQLHRTLPRKLLRR